MGLGRLRLDEDDDADEERMYVMLNRSEKACSFCQDMLLYSDEVFVLTVSAVQVTTSGMVYPPLATEDGLDFLFEPHFFCFSCLESAVEDLRSAFEDVPPIEDMYAVTDCASCGSGIRDGESVVISCFGELHLSSRQPNNEAGSSTFASMDDDPDVICIVCANYMATEIFDELWEGPIQQVNECMEGTYARCWRHGCSAQGDCGNCVEEQHG